MCVRTLGKGMTAGSLTAVEDVPAGHKIALRALPAGSPVRKYGATIGVATANIPAGAHVHVHNLRSHLDEASDPPSRCGTPTAWHAETAAPLSSLSFMGYRRQDGRVATRNEIWIVPTVACVNRVAEQLAAAGREQWAGELDGIVALPHPVGCSQLGDDLAYTQSVLAGLIGHPNAAGVLLIGLGCESNRIEDLLRLAARHAPESLWAFAAQEVPDELDTGMAHLADLVRQARHHRRVPIPASELVVGTKCGGSDGFSGITANPLVGRVTERLAREGATILLSEVPEMFGAEEALVERAVDEAVADSVLHLTQAFRDDLRRHGHPIDQNPSPGNRAGGITTLAEKSLGCVQKCGRVPIAGVLTYGSPAPPRLGGVALVEAPGNDGVSGTALAAAGAHLVLFTTGRGTPLGFPVPTLKIAATSDLALRKPAWIDFDAGPLLEGEDAERLADDLLKLTLDVAGGVTCSQNERHGFREIAVWKRGVTL